MPERAEPRFASGLLMLADISGYTAFLARVAEAHSAIAADPEPVPPAYDFMITLLDLVAERLRHGTHLAGPAVNLAPRLLKNGVTERTGLRGYALLTDPALELLGLDPSIGLNHSESYADAGAVTG